MQNGQPAHIPTKRQLRIYTREFETEADRLAEQIGARQATGDLKINDPMLRDWVRTLGAEGAEVFRGQGKRTAVQAEMTRMRRGIAVFRQPRDNQKSCGIPGKGVFAKNGFIKGHRCIGPLQVLCQAMQVSVSGSLCWRNRPITVEAAYQRGEAA
jgi:transposase-like protein